jgi:hypothetical protein
MSNPGDLFAKLNAESEQAKAGLKEFAGYIRTYYEALVEDGFTPEQALELSSSYQTAMVMTLRDGGS